MYVVETKQEHIDYLIENRKDIRNSDIKEVWAYAHLSIDVALQKSFELSTLCWTGMLKKEPILCFGVAPFYDGRNKGSPWLLGTNKMDLVTFFILEYSKKYLIKMLDYFNFLENYVDARNKKSITWLKWCGFVIEEAKPFGADGLPFHKFWLEKSNV